jgi:hypothetical protein
MNDISEKRICQNCRGEFIIEPDDFGFYEKMQVPPPTFCPECRVQRRMIRRNERVLYSRTCAGSGKKIISYYEASVPFPVYGREYWYSDNWDGTIYGRPYDFSKNFFEQFIALAQVAPRLNLWQVNSVNSDYSNYIVDSKNCYLCFTALGNNEDSMYSSYITGSINCLDCDLLNKCDRCYECFNCDTCYNCQYSIDSNNCRDSAFLADCNNCSDCFGCVGLRDKQYHIWNKPYNKEEYKKELSILKIPARQNVNFFKEKLSKLWMEFPHRYMHSKKNENVTGDYVTNSKNCKNSFMINNSEDSKNLFYCLNLKSSMEVTVSTVVNELLYECHAIPKQNQNIKFSDLCSNGCSEVEYSSNCDGCSHIFGCIGLRKKEYCILNKQYSKEEYQELVEKIKKQMDDIPYTDRSGRSYKYGEFFPPEASPFAYNESIAQEYFPLTKAEAEKSGYSWKELKEKNYKPTISPLAVPEDLEKIKDDFINEVVGCLNEGKGNHNCTTAFRILPNELQFYRQSNIPIPLYCPNCRHHQRVRQRNSMKLSKRICQCAGEQSQNGVYKNTAKHIHQGKCEVEFETSYSPDRPEMVYCEKCYQQEVY